ncbi:transglutaminase-like cysteine peptidase [uncultured Neptuniibacter sp.]|uniref:transglutaminase-like cysteine peptidase n=1 Tax=uncultured Neptuniibacter sp. TaxID=502143 RepID=UPI00262B525B|nr:transglutaminase-like cysteine peptidase [uncultured Neptuniibacter sp.]
MSHRLKSLPLSLIALLAFTLFNVSPLYGFTHIIWTEDMYHFVGKKYGWNAERRMRQWHQVIERNGRESWLEDLQAVNGFFNRVSWTSDSSHWGKKEYWQTPLETLIEFKGDCEDIAIAKYTTLRIMGYTEKQLNLVYSLAGKTPHMVLTFYPQGQDHPYVLDSLNKQLLTSDQRRDLTTVYEFNNDSLWLTDKHFEKYKRTQSRHLALLDELKVRLDNNRHLLRSHNRGKPVVPFASNTL